MMGHEYYAIHHNEIFPPDQYVPVLHSHFIFKIMRLLLLIGFLVIGGDVPMDGLSTKDLTSILPT